MEKIIKALILSLLILPIASQASTPRGYKTVPNGFNLFEIIYGYTEGEAESDTPLAGSTLEIRRHTTLLRYVHYFDWGGDFSGFSVMLPLVDQELSVYNKPAIPGMTLGDQSGVGDPTFVIASNIFGQPAMELEEYIGRYKSGKPVYQDSLNWSLWVTSPMGRYEPDSFVNAGENRWAIKPEINYMHIADKVWLEANAAVTFYTDNSDYQGANLEQDPLLTLEGHISIDTPIRLSQDLTIPAWASLSLYGKIGGETSVNGTARNDASNDWELSGRLYMRLHKQFAARVFYSKTIKHEKGKFDTDTAGLRLTYIF